MKVYLQIGIVVGLALVAYFTSSSMLEIVAAITGLLCVYLNARENIWAYPTGFINAGCFIVMFYNVQLYADMTLQFIFLILMAFGWYIWLTKRQGSKVRPTTSLSFSGFGHYIFAIFVLGILWGAALQTWTDASIPYLDATVAMASIVAQFLLSRKVLQNWILWIAVDIVSIGMYWYKGLHLTSYLYLVFLGIATYGYFHWRRNYATRAHIG